MCISKEVSIVAWVTAFLISIFLWKRNKNYDRWNAAFILTFSAIQLLEAGLWLSIEKENLKMNTTLTKIVLIALWMQPFVQSYSGFLNTGKIPLLLLSIVFAIIIVWALSRIFINPTSKFFSSVGEDGHLVWNSSENRKLYSGGEFLSGGCGLLNILYLIGLFIPLLFMVPLSTGLFLMAIGIGTYTWAQTQTTTDEFGSMWCLVAVIYALAAVLV